MNLPTIPSWASVALKFAPYIVIAILSGLLYLAHGKVGSLTDTITAKDAKIATVTTQRDFFSKAVADRDTLIGTQNRSIDALVTAAAADRTVYLKGLDAARVISADHVKASTELLALKAPDGELAQCHAARDLLESELVQ